MLLKPISFMKASGASPVNPNLVSATYTVGSAGNAAAVDQVLTYAGADTLTTYGVTSNTGTAPSKANIKAIAGIGTLEGFSFATSVPTDSDDLTGLTSTSEAATHIHVYVEENTNGGSSAVVTEAVSALDFTIPAAPTAATDVAGDTITLTFAESIYGAQDLGDWVVSGVVSGTPTIDSVSGFGTSTLTIEISTNLVLTGETITIAYTNTDSDLRDASANLLANFSGLSVTNNVSAGGGLTKTFVDQSAAVQFLDAGPMVVDLSSVNTGDNLYIGIVMTQGSATSAITTAVDLEGTTMTQKAASAAGSNRTKAYVYQVTCPAAASGNAAAEIAVAATAPVKNGIAAVYKIVGTVSTETTATDEGFPPAVLDASVNTVADGVVLAFTGAEDDTSDLVNDLITYAGVTQDGVTLTDTVGNEIECASFDVVSTETPRTVTVTLTTGARESALAVIALS